MVICDISHDKQFEREAPTADFAELVTAVETSTELLSGGATRKWPVAGGSRGEAGMRPPHFSFRLLDIGLDNLLSGEEVPHSASVELVSKRVEESVKDGICLCHNWEHLQAETRCRWW